TAKSRLRENNPRLPPLQTMQGRGTLVRDRKSTRLNSSHANNSYAVFCLEKTNDTPGPRERNPCRPSTGPPRIILCEARLEEVRVWGELEPRKVSISWRCPDFFFEARAPHQILLLFLRRAVAI